MYSYHICYPEWMFTEIMLQFIFYVCFRMMGGWEETDLLPKRNFFAVVDIKMDFLCPFFLLFVRLMETNISQKSYPNGRCNASPTKTSKVFLIVNSY